MLVNEKHLRDAESFLSRLEHAEDLQCLCDAYTLTSQYFSFVRHDSLVWRHRRRRTEAYMRELWRLWKRRREGVDR